MADKKKIALIAAGGLIVAILCFLSVKGCADNREQDKRLQNLENNDSTLFDNDEDLRATDSILFNNDQILNRQDSMLNRRVDDLYDSVAGLRHDIDSCCDCNKKPVKKPVKKTVAVRDTANNNNPVPVNNNPQPAKKPCASVDVSNSNGVVIISGDNNSVVVGTTNPSAAQLADTAQAIRRAVVRCRWENVK